MEDTTDHVNKTNPQILARILGAADADRPWRREELGAILRHQLSAPVEFDLTSLGRGVARKLKMLGSTSGLLLNSFDALLHHPNPPLELLLLTKQFAKANRDHPDSPLPREVATVLYFASITVALIHCGERITSLDDEPLRRGIEWAIALPWIDSRTRALLQQGLEHLEIREEGQDA